MEFIATCSCKHWVGYAESENAANALGSSHARDAAHTPTEHDEHAVTVRRAGF